MHAVRLVHEFDAAPDERAMLLLDVLYAKIEKRAGVILLGILGRRQHEPHRADLEERQRRRRLEQERQAEGVAVKADGAFDVVDDVGDLGELHAAIHLLRRLRVEDKAMGLTAPRASVLSVLVFRGPVTMSALAEAEQVRPPTITRLVDGLERRGLVRRVGDRDDGRVQLVEATAAGKRLLQKGRARRVARLARGVASLSADDQRVLARAADLMEQALLVTFEPLAP